LRRLGCCFHLQRKPDPLSIDDSPVFFINGSPVWIPIQATSETVGSQSFPSLGTDVFVITYPSADGKGTVFMDLTDGVFENRFLYLSDLLLRYRTILKGSAEVEVL
jgi:hypothetical protein